jgi:dTDP-4-dehydrorhamnose reductase
MNTVLITGASGLLGSSLVPYLKKIGYKIISHANTRPADINFDLSDMATTFRFLDQINPSIIINLVSLTSVERCEEQVGLAYLTNTKTVENLVRWIEQKGLGTHLIQISTDHVYDGDGPHQEDEINITNNYALTKYSAELVASRLPSTILRTNFVGLSKVQYRESLTDWVYNSIKNNHEIEVLTDVLFSPLSISKLLEVIEFAIRQKPMGTFNVGSRNGMSKADFDFMFAECLNLPTGKIQRLSISEVQFLRAYRPRDMRMDSSKIENLLGYQLPMLTEIIREVASDYR